MRGLAAEEQKEIKWVSGWFYKQDTPLGFGSTVVPTME
jgi:hypothetical protein